MVAVGKKLRATQFCVWSVSDGFRCSGIKGKLKSNVDFRCKRCLDEGLVVTVLKREVEIEPNVKLELVPKFWYLGKNLNWQPSWKIVSFNVDKVV